MQHIINQVQPGLEPIEPQFNPIVLRLIHCSLPLLLRLRLFPWLPSGINQIDVINGETLAKAFNQFQSGKIRLILAFRHVEVNDPLCGLYLLSRSLPKVAKNAQIPLKNPLHVHFLYDRGMPLWGGSALGWILSRLGGISLRRGKQPDWQSLRKARSLLLNGQFPFAVAPEGATNGHSEFIGSLESGVAQLGFWTVEALKKAKRPETVLIIPVGIQYFYQNAPWHRLAKLMSELEVMIGLPVVEMPTGSDEELTTQFYQRLLSIGEALLDKFEQFYQKCYPTSEIASDAFLEPEDRGKFELGQRIESLVDRALVVAESYFGIKPKGTPEERCRRIEEMAWTRIYRSDLEPRSSLSALERGLADWMAQEASLRMVNMRLAESFVAVRDDYVAKKMSFERFAETTLLIFDALARIRGDKLPHRPRLGWRQARLSINQPILVNSYWESYQVDRQGAKRAIAHVTRDIRKALEGSLI